MPRVISVFLPTLSTDRVRRKAGDTAPSPETPLILVGQDGRRRVILAADAAAHAAGLRVGMPASKAQALVQGLVIQDADPIADAEALERLAFWMLQRFAPIVAADPPDGIVIDSIGADHLHGGEAATLAILVEKLAGVGLRARRHRRHLGRSPCPCPLRCAAWLGVGARECCGRRRAIVDRSVTAGVGYGPGSSCPRF
jgi:protein ImuB